MPSDNSIIMIAIVLVIVVSLAAGFPLSAALTLAAATVEIARRMPRDSDG